MRRVNLSLVFFPALFLLIFSMAVLGGTAAAFTEGVFENFFGTGAGSVNTGTGNSFFGGYAGSGNTIGHSLLNNPSSFKSRYNSFFGGEAGESSVTGNFNSFFGGRAGSLNTDGELAFFRCPFLADTPATTTLWSLTTPSSDLPPISTDDQVGHQRDGNRCPAWVAQSDSLVLGSIAGLNSATRNVNVGIGTPAPARQLHLG